jgi:hypothetical protein
MLHAYFYTICLVFCYTLWHFYAFSGTNLLTSRHSASSLFSAIFVFQKSYTRFTKASREPKKRRSGAMRAPHNRAVWPGPWPRLLCVRAPRPTPDAAPSPIKSLRREKPKGPITFPEHIAIRRRRWPEDREGLEALPGTLPERVITTAGLLHRHACLRCDEWVVYLGLWVHSSS